MELQRLSGFLKKSPRASNDVRRAVGNDPISVRFKFADELRKIVEYIELNTKADALAV